MSRKFDITKSPRHALKEFIDADYLDRLSPDERKWYEDFCRAYYQGNGPRAGEFCKGDMAPKAAGRDGRKHKGKSAGEARYNAAYRDAYARGSRCDYKEVEKINLDGEEE